MTIGRAVLIGWGSRLASIVLSLVNTRLLLDLMGAHDYAAYAILVSLAPWFVLCALGVPNAAQNLISELRAKGKSYEQLKSTAANAATWAAICFSLPTVVIGWAVKVLLLADYPTTGLLAIVLIALALLLNGLCTIFNQLLYAEHRGEWPNAMPAIIGAVTCLLLLLSKSSGGNPALLAATSYFVPAVLVFAIAGNAAGAFRSFGLDVKLVLDLVDRGRAFLLFIAISTGALSLDYVLMSRLLSSSQIVEYNIANKLFGVFITVHAVLLASSWSRLADLYHQNDLRALRKSVGLTLLAGCAATVIPALLVAGYIDPLTALLGGPVAPVPSKGLTTAWCGLLLLRVWSDTFAVATMACGHLATMNFYIAAQTIVSVTAQWWLGRHYGPAGITAGIALSFIVTAAWILPYRFSRLTRSNLVESAS